MKNVILNITANSSWQTLGEAEGFPQGVYHLKLKARGANDMHYRWVGQDDYWEVQSNEIVTFHGKFDPGDLQVLAVSGVIIQVECNGQPYGGFGGWISL